MLRWLFSSNRSSVDESVVAAGFKAISEDDANRLNELLTYKKLPPNARDKKGFTLVHKAVLSSNRYNSANKAALIEILVQAGADVNAGYRHEEGEFLPIHSAVRRKNAPIVQVLMDYKADLLAKDGKQKTALDYIGQSYDDRGREVAQILVTDEKVRQGRAFT